MSEASDGSKMATRASKRCTYCDKELEIDSRYCNHCGHRQEGSPDPNMYCINPDCKEELFTISAKTCHKCHMPQKHEDSKEPKTQQQNPGEKKSTDQHKAGVKRTVESIRKDGYQGDNNQTQEKSKDTKNEQRPPPPGSSTGAQETSHRTVTSINGDQTGVHTDQQMHGGSVAPTNHPEQPDEQTQPESGTPPKKLKTTTADSQISQGENAGGGGSGVISKVQLQATPRDPLHPMPTDQNDGDNRQGRKRNYDDDSTQLSRKTQKLTTDTGGTTNQVTANVGGITDTGETSGTQEATNTGRTTSTRETTGTGGTTDTRGTTNSGDTPGTKATTDSGETPGTTDSGETSGTKATTDSGETPGTTDTGETPGTKGTTDSGETPGTTDSGETSGTKATTDSGETPGTTDTGETPGTKGTTDTGETPGTKGTTDTGETPGTKGTTDTGETPGTKGTTDTGETASTKATTNAGTTTNTGPTTTPSTDPKTSTSSTTQPGSSSGSTPQNQSAYRKPNFEDQPQLLESSRGKGGGEVKGGSGRNIPPAGDTHGYQTRSRGPIEVDTTGVHASHDRSIAVTFHVIVPPEVWNWDKKSSIHIQFGHPKLGNWKRNIGEFCPPRDVGDGLYEMYCTLHIDVDVLKSQASIPYKYVIYSSSTERNEKPHEFLHGAEGRGEIVNRCLRIPTHRFHPRGYFQQYDSMAYPETKMKSVFTKIGETIKGLFVQTEKQEEINVPNHEAMQEKCLYVYLENYYKLLCDCELSKLTITEVADEMFHIFQQLHSPLVYYHNDSHVWRANLSQKMKFWLLSIIQELQARPSDVPEENGSRIVSVLTVIYCFDQLIPHHLKIEDIKLDDIATTLSMLALKPVMKHKKCDDFHFVLNLIDPNSRKSVAEAIRGFCTHLAHSRTLRNPEWLYAVPLLHFLRNDSSPFQMPVMNPERMQWGDKNLGLTTVRSETHDKQFGFIAKHFEQMKPLAEVDPLFLQVVVYICPKKELPALMKQIPPFVSATWLSSTVSKSTYLYTNEIEDIAKLVAVITEVMKETVKKMNYQHLDSSLSASLLLFSRLKGKLEYTTEVRIRSLKASISLVLHSAVQLRSHEPNNPELLQTAEKKVNETLNSLYQYLKEWVSLCAIFGPSFGHYLHRSAKGELEMWESILQTDCPEKMASDWHGIVRKIVTERVERVGNSNSKVDLFLMLETRGETHTLLTEIFMEAALHGLQHMMSEQSKDTAANVNKLWLNTRDKKRVGRLLGSLLIKHGTDSVTFDDLLKWDLWPCFISIYANESLISTEHGDTAQSCLPEECYVMCVRAHSSLEEVCRQIIEGSISIKELQKISNKMGQMKRLCTAASTNGNQNQEPQQFAFQNIKAALDQRMDEYKAFNRRKEHLVTFCSRISVKVKGLEDLKQELKKDYSSTNINVLCSSDGQKPFEFHCFTAANPLDLILAKFNFLSTKHVNDLFPRIWEDKMKAAVRGNPDLTIGDIVTQVWEPTFLQCQQLLDELQSRSIRLSVVDERFGRYQTRLDDLNRDLTKLCHGVNSCLNNFSAKTTWIRGVVQLMQQYWSLCQCASAAETFLELKQRLQLRGNFDVVEALAAKVTTSMRDKTLASIDQNLIETGEFLREFAADHKKLECLQTFARCLTVVQWIRKETKDVNDLQNFVNVALATAAGGEDALTHDKLSNLRTVGSHFGALIYNLKETADFRTLADGCKLVWQAMERTSSLPKLLEGCNAEIEWYKMIKDTQGDIERTSVGQMENIQKYGSYMIGSSRPQTFQSIHQVIHLTLEERDKPLPKKSYTLDDLRDLESKLVLITGSKAENRKEVDQFLDTLHSVCRIAEVLLALQQKGNVKYTGWVLSFRCAVDMVGELQQQARDMEEELQTWEEEVRQARKEYYELNYYTTLQLLTLRKELGRLKTSEQPRAHTQIKPQVLALLESISTEITSPCVWDVVKSITAEQQRGGASVFSAQHYTSAEMLSVSTAGPSSQVVPSVQPRQPSLADDILASADMQTSTSASRVRLQQPKLTHDQLTEKQKEMFDNLRNCDYSEQLILIALEKFREDQYEAENWIADNVGQYSSSDDEGGEIDIDEKMDSESDSEQEPEVVPKTPPMQSPVATSAYSTPPKLKGPSTPKMDCSPSMDCSPRMDHSPRVEIHVTQKEAVDEYHPTVQQLVDAGYNVERSIDAVEHHEVLEEAMDYLLNLEEGGEIFQATTSVSAVERHQYREEGGTEEESQYERKVMVGDMTLTICRDEKVAEQYLMLPELGRVLQELRRALPAAVPSPRHFPADVLDLGTPNLLVTTPENVLRTALALYMDGGGVALPLPTHEEVLVCNQATTTEEVTLLWQRAIGDPGFKRTFCILHAEKLSYQVSDQALRSLTELSQGPRQDYRLVIICSNEDEDKSHIISRLNTHRKHFTTLHDVEKFREYLKTHFTGAAMPTHQSLVTQGVSASMVDCGNSCVRVVSSTRSGMGKSLFITRMADKLTEYTSMDARHVTIPIHGPEVTPDTVMEFLNNHMKGATSTIFHFDIAPTILWKVDTILFCLLVLRGLNDSQGRVWRCHPTQLYAIEVTLPEQPEQQAGQHAIPESCTLSLLALLPSVECLSPQQAVQLMKTGRENPFKVVMDKQEFENPHYQRVYQYLRRHIGNINLDRFSYIGNVEGTTTNCLEIILHSCGLRDPSWAEIRHFVMFLDIQLQSCEMSVFCDENFVGDVMAGLKGFVVKFMIRMSRDFATSSLHGEVVREEGTEPVPAAPGVGGDLEQYQIVERRQWEHSSHPYIFFNQDGMSITFVGFMVTRNGDLVDPTHGGVLEGAIMTQQLYTGLIANKVNFEEDYRKWQKATMIEKIATVMGIEYPYDPDESYVLTVDNLIKILAIQMRFRCGIPVVIMGETGCGKTRLIRYMCDLARQGMDRNNMLIMKVHGGITESDVTKFIEKAEEEAKINRQCALDTVVFFDEANTTDAIGLIKEIMCDRRLHGRPISRDLKFIAACNPYRKHSEEMIEKLESAGLGFYVRATETQQKLGKIPLRQLVYRVLDLPPSMRPLVYDFGQLTTRTEKDYTRQIVFDHVTKHPALKHQPATIPSVARVLAWSQWYMRRREDECSFVSLRDVERAMVVFEYFFDKMDIFGPKMDEMAARINRERKDMEEELPPQPPFPDPITRSLLLAISVCYHARLQDREDYEGGVTAQFVAPLGLPGGAAQFRNEIQCCQEVLLDSMTLGPNIARNAALRENVFMMAICIELRIPLFLVGKPGSSKSLAKSIVQASMQGTASSSELLRGFKQVHIFSYQCSQLSTPESVIEVFKTAQRFQRNQDTTKYVSVVVLDEVGLAEDSPNLPLKALHPLLEDGTEGADDKQEFIQREKRVAFIGISNWALDPAKMNRGVMVTRGDPDTRELQLSARGICSNELNDPVKIRLEPYFEPLAEAYKKICKKQKKEFFGLRDFYCLVKMLYWMCEKSGLPPTGPQLEHAICRNFGGMESDELDTLEEFQRYIPSRDPPDLQSIPEKLHSIVNPDCSSLGLIKTSLMTKETSWHGENRYLLFLTENYAALEILRHYLNDVVHSSPSEDGDERSLEKMEPFILFGSSFPRDKEYTQVCRNINQIKICMETGRTVILLNLENLYESLYDVLNQYYIYHGGSRYVDLGLQTHRVKCRVHDNFKLIVIAEKNTVYEKFPTPLINRLEKHFVLTSSVLTEGQQDVLHHFEDWIKQFSSVSRTSEGRKFTEGDAFIGYQKDTPAAVVFQATHQLDREGPAVWERTEPVSVLGPRAEEEEEASHVWKENVLKWSQYLLLQTASPDALVRLEQSPLADQKEELLELYFQRQHHNSLENFLAHHLQRNGTRGENLLMQVTTHSHLLSRDELDHVSGTLSLDQSHIHAFSLQEFDTELDFSNKVSPAFQRRVGDTHDSLLVIQCDSGHLNGDLIACARYRIYDKRAETSQRNEREWCTHVLFIIHLPRQVVSSSFVGFQGEPWISTHIDDLRPTTGGTITVQQVMGVSISQLFCGKMAADKGGRVGEKISMVTEKLEKMYQQHETESMQVEGDHATTVQEGFDQDDEMSVEEEERPQSPPPQLSEQSQMDTSIEGDTPHEAPQVEEPLNLTSDSAEAPVKQIVPPTRGIPEGQILPPTKDDSQEEVGPHTPPWPVEGSQNTQFRRLHGCIQPAAARLQDSAKNKERATKRVALLVNLIPRDPSFPPDDSTFHGVLVRHIHRLLTERDEIREDEKNWVLNEALSARKLQNGGTFQNVLARKLDDVLVPIFSEIIALVDRNYNLNHLKPKKQNPPLCQFWLAMFRNPAIMQLRYEDMVTTQGGGHREQVPGAGGRMAEEDFKCQLPFSWLVKEAVDTQWHSAKSTVGGSSGGQLHSQLCELMSQTAIGEVLQSVDEADCEQFYQYYLHDFVRSVHRCHHKQEKSENLEYKLIGGALNSLVHGPDFATIDGHESLTSRIAALHVVYHFARPQVLWFGQLVSHLPGTMTTLEDKVPHDNSEMVLHLHAVNHALGSLEPPLDKKDSEDKEKAVLASWLNQLRLSQNAIDSILNLPSQSELANRARLKWQLIRALQMFVEHVVLKNEGMIPYLRRLHMHLKHDANFLKASTVDKVKKHLNSMDNEFKKKLKSQPKKLTPIRRNCRAFFMELVSTLCFGAHSAPEPDLIEMLINTVFTEKQETEVGTRDFTPYRETKSDEVPVIRSFLLQLLLEHNTEQVKAHLEEYFRRSQQVLTRGELDQNLCLLCIQCFEDALSKEYALKPSQERAAAILEEGHLALQHHTGHSHGEISLGYIEGVAKVRFALSVVAELFHKHEAMGPALLHGVREVCTDATINHVDGTGQTDTIGPVLYLLKLIVRQYGFPCLAEVSTAHTWVVPPELRRADEEQRTVDPFVIYNPHYSDLRECVSGAVYGKQMQQLKESTEDLTLQDAPLLLLALYEKATLSRASALPSRQLLPDVLEELNKFILECKILPREMQWMARSLVANEQGGTLAQLGVDPRQPLQHRTLGAIVVHTAAVFLCRQKVDILQPFVNMLNNPAVLVNAYLPTMTEDTLPEAKRVLGGKFYQCPRGHPYMVGDCGRVVVQHTCNVCGATIGGVNYKLAQDNREARTNDTTQAGYSLGMPEGRSTLPSPERSLSPAACCLVRALMHSALLWASCNNENAMEGLTQLVKVGVHPRDLPEFFWRHLERDVELLGRATGKSMDESAITVHLVLREILLKAPPTSIVTTVTSLGARNAREQWENIFNQNYIQPVLQGLEQKLAEALHSILNDDKQEHDQLFYLVYERVQVVEGSLDPHLWAYRSRITLEHLRQNLQQQNMKKKCPILHAFLQEETNLRATQYLPDIIRLQQCLYDSFHHRLDRKEARRMTIGEFLQSRKHENVRREYQEMVESLQKAWELVGDKLRDHARLKVEEKHLLPSFTLDTSLEYLIPTTMGAGACTTALTDFLVLTHNSFIETCRAIVIKQNQSKSQWREHKVPITHIHGCHLLTYEQQLPSIILSHCRYSLSMGKGQDVSYDLLALEKHLLDRFIHGKPFILSDIPQVVYRKDVYTAVTFAAVRKKVEPQTSLPPRTQQEILQELRTPDRLRETLDVVDIVLGFLSSGGGRADQPLGGYVNHTLKMKRRPFSEKAREYCTLGHVLSLWETLSVELARQLTIQGQEPFDLDSMPEYLMEELTTDGEEDQVEALGRCLRVLDLDNLLGTLYEFIETYVKHSPSNEKDWLLVDTLEVFLERNGLPQIKDFREEFPETITLAQAVDVWKRIVWYQRRLVTHGTMKQ